MYKKILLIASFCLISAVLLALEEKDYKTSPSDNMSLLLDSELFRKILPADGGGWVVFAYTSDDHGGPTGDVEFFSAFEGLKIGNEAGEPATEVFWFTQDSVFYALPRAGKVFSSAWNIVKDSLVASSISDPGPILSRPKKLSYKMHEFPSNKAVEQYLTVKTIEISGPNDDGETQWWYLAPISVTNTELKELEFGELLPWQGENED